MKLKPKGKLLDHFSEIEDSRIKLTKRHKLIDILTIAILHVVPVVHLPRVLMRAIAHQH